MCYHLIGLWHIIWNANFVKNNNNKKIKFSIPLYMHDMGLGCNQAKSSRALRFQD